MEPIELKRRSAGADDIEALRRENAELRARLDRIDAQRDATREARKKGLRIGFGVLIPLLDRQRVVRSFGEMANQAIRLADPNDRATPRDVAESAKEFLSCCVRFAIRRRLFIMIFAVLAAAVPAIQLWLVVQQNEIVQRQNDFFEIQLYDQVANSMTEKKSAESRKMTGLLLANADPAFLHRVMREVFEPNVANVLQSDQLAKPEWDAAAYRGVLLRSLARGLVLQRENEDRDDEEIYAQARRSLEFVYLDAAGRLPLLLRRSRRDPEQSVDAEVHYYLAQLGQILRVHSRFARTVDQEDSFYSASAPLFAMLGRVRVGNSPLDKSLGFALESFLIDLAEAPKIGAPDVSVPENGGAKLVARGLERLAAQQKKYRFDAAAVGAFVEAVNR